jgi:CubicO group peptidase (beta-lactamase class C family)
MPPPFSASNNDGFWETTAASAVGLEANLLKEHIALCAETGADAQLVVHRGQIVSEWYSDRYSLPVYAMSSTKAITSVLLGILVDEGRIASWSDAVTRYLPEWTGGWRDKVTIEQLATHTAGFDRRFERGQSVGYEIDKTGFVLGLSPDREPGSRYAYSNEGVQLLEPVITRAAGQPCADFARDRLFQPLGMHDTSLNIDSVGHAWTYADMKTTARDLARVGLLMANGGLWNGQQIVSADYVRRATEPSATKREMGHLWWILYSGRQRLGFYASGYLNTDIYVFPDADMVIVRTQAPKAGFTGQAESGNYFKEAVKLFARLVK